MAELFTTFEGGWRDPERPADLHPHLRGEGGVRIARWLVEQGVTSAETADVAAVLEAYASGWAPDVAPSILLDILRGALARPGMLSSPPLTLLLQHALTYVHDSDELRAFIEFLKRTALLQTLSSGSGPIPPHDA